MEYAIEITNLSKYFMQGFFVKRMKPVYVLQEISLKVKYGELFGLVGPNGAGKSTLIKTLCCLILPIKGTANVAGYDILENQEEVKASIGLVNGEERSFYWRLTGKQNLHFFASLHNLSSNQAKTKIKELLDFLEIEEPDKRFQEYSAGIKQRLSIARSLLNNPKILFMDEPTKSLDPYSAQKLRAFIKDKLVRQQNMTVFFATHNLEEAEYLSSRIALIDKGEIKISGTMQEIKKDILACFFVS